MNTDRNLLRTLRDEINEALQAVAAKHNISIEAGAASFTLQNATFKLAIAVKDETGTALSKERTDWIRFASLYQLDPSKLDAIVTVGQDQFRIIGLLPKSRSFPILAERVTDGKRLKLGRQFAMALPKPQ